MQVPPTRRGDQAEGRLELLPVDTVRRELKANGFTDQEIDLGGLRVDHARSTSASSARPCARCARSGPGRTPRNVHIGLSAVQPGTGAVVAMYGGADRRRSQRGHPGAGPAGLDVQAVRAGRRARRRHRAQEPARRQLAARAARHRQARSTTSSTATTGRSVDLVKATEDSINTAYVDLTLDMGARKVVDAAVDAGIPADTPGLEANAVITLGTASVRNIDMATAYATFAAKGKAATLVHRAGGQGRQRRHPLRGAPAHDAGLRRGRRGRRDLRACSRS